MDLKEAQADNQKRHPWETSRLDALHDILCDHLTEGVRVLDIGCGDGFVAENLFSGLRHREVAAVDSNLTREQLVNFTAARSDISFQRELPQSGSFDLILLLDVLEHIEDDVSFLKNVVNRYLEAKGAVMITVPAFQALFSGHDAFLGHYRRYSLPALVQLAEVAGLKVRRSGYLFSSLLLPKLVLFKLLNSADVSEGVGQWRRGALLTSLIKLALRLDNKLLLAAGRLGIKIPGLTGWVLCEKQG
ncbi:class I SAM-dependent methyltransferase [Geomonas subterranea]|uniref:Class I SAM-dependent methyltransferase n=1 Tax=Geomonas subterranea TaxID=2847989 RepID=A0ABX8LLP5_9BACT|nr:class I SAM-dependent methyltransferase [Geomonas subterranea]QXE92261.1 class I SAM-dependent methyltransferase [Geomonas subterranea]QXM09639.1 class I SAM-dependent methyltransferase [Geomonas subterranea]